MARIKIWELKMNSTWSGSIRIVYHLVNNFQAVCPKSKFTASIDWNSNYSVFETRLFQSVKKIIYMKEHGYKDILDGRRDRRITYFETPIRPPRSRGKDTWHHRHAINMRRNGEDWIEGSSELCIRPLCDKISCNI